MKTFVPIGLQTEPSLALCRAAYEFVLQTIEMAPLNFRARGSLGPVLVLPLFLQKMIIRLGPLGITTQGFNKIDKRLTRFAGYEVSPGYELAVIIFFPDQGPFSENAIYRVELTQTNLLRNGA